MTEKGPCSVEGCESTEHLRGWCQAHYARWQRWGSPTGGIYRDPNRECSVDECTEKARARGLCNRHYARWRKFGDPLKGKNRSGRNQCTVDECDRWVFGHGYCVPHYKRWRRWGDPNVKRPKIPAEQRFWSKVKKNGAMPPQATAQGACWDWKAGKTKAGYGVFRPAHGQGTLAHRYAYELLIGPIPEGLVIDHLCRNRGCVNPDHMEPVTTGENTRRGFGISTWNRLKTHCPKGHPYDVENTYIHPSNNGRICRQCARERDRQPNRNATYRRQMKKLKQMEEA